MVFHVKKVGWSVDKFYVTNLSVTSLVEEHTIFLHITNIQIILPVYEANRHQDIDKYKMIWTDCIVKFLEAFLGGHRDHSGRSVYRNIITWINMSSHKFISHISTLKLFFQFISKLSCFLLSTFHYITNKILFLMTYQLHNLIYHNNPDFLLQKSLEIPLCILV